VVTPPLGFGWSSHPFSQHLRKMIGRTIKYLMQGLADSFAPAWREMPWKQRFNRLSRRGCGSQGHHFFVRENEEWRSISRERLGFPPLPQPT